ncbi:uncharacterized protein DDB_G0283357-like [Plodia interpunctella]|uniref:uncharacterized protein DDB_G0283357-like n=1 Tax=Plodia interpunctella TaxID=58824 RepID=UPI002368DF03|nr:uncharacterized protein DDB_G0283357-like [Plodia interpunctella]
MRCLVLIAVVMAMATARPEKYREKEDFQYSRSSSDEGSKSGYYGAQRGNMGGNYERAHNMDSLAQHQMSGLIHQVDGELGEAANTKTGSVFTAANSRGMYGSGHYNLGNLEGRNFQEGTSFGNSHSQSALTNSAYRDHSSNENRYRNSNSYSHSSRHSNSEQSQYEQEEGVQNSHLRSGDSAYQQEYGVYDGSSRLSHSASPYQNRLVSTRPMKILLRPGTRVAIPLATQTYDAEHGASSYDADQSASSYNADHTTSSHDSSVYNQHAARTDAELIANNDQESHIKHVPANKYYESSYNYHKEWEKHDNSPGAVPLAIDENSIPKASELYDDSHHSQAYNSRNRQYTSNTAGSHNSHTSNSYGYNTKSNLASSSHSRQQSEYEVQRDKLNSELSAFTNAHENNDLDENEQGTTNSKPKSYQSSYSYHKSWERQGDPYVIVPVPDVKNGHSSQRLTDSNRHNGYSSHQYGSNHKSSHQRYSSSNGLMDCDCDDEGHIRVARSYNTDQEVQYQQNDWEVSDQQSQNHWDKIQDLGQQTQNNWDRYEDLGQQSQNQWDKIEDLGQQSQNHWDQIQDLGQQTQNKWDKFEDLGKHTQNQRDKIEHHGHQTQNKLDKTEDLGPNQNQWDKIEDLGQQTQNQWDETEDLGQHSKNQWDNTEDLGQQTHRKWDKFENFSQHSWGNQDLDQQAQRSVDQDQSTWRNIEKSHKRHDTNNYELEQGATSVSLFEDKDTDIFSSHNIFREISTTTTSPQDNDKHASIRGTLNYSQNSQHFYGHENKHFWNSDQSFFNTPMNTTSDGEKHSIDKQSSLDTEQTVLQNNYLHQQITEKTLSDANTTHTSSINNLWDKLDRLDKESSLNNVYNTTNYSYNKEITNTEKSKDFDKSPKHPKDAGRGDIENEDINFELNTNFDKNDIDNKEYRTAQIEALTSSINPNNATHMQHATSDEKPTDISLESIQPLNRNFNNSYNKINNDKDEKHSDRNIHQENINHEFTLYDHHNLNKETDHQDFEKHEEIGEKYLNQNDLKHTNRTNEYAEQQNKYHHFNSINQQNENLDQQSMQQGSQYFDGTSGIFKQSNLSQNLEDLGPLNGNFDQNKLHRKIQYSNHNNEHQNMESFDKSTTDQHQFDQGLTGTKIEQDNADEYLQGFGESKEDFDQKNSNEPLMDFGQSNYNFDQLQRANHPLETFNQQTFNDENLDPQNMEQNLENFDKFSDNFGQDKLEQNLEDFSKTNEIYDQQSINKLYDSYYKKSDNMEKLNYMLDQHNINQNFGNEKLEVDRIAREHFDQHNQDPNSAQEIKILSQNAAQSYSKYPASNTYEDKNVQNELLHTTEPEPVAPGPEQTGFWASIGKKFTKAKDKVTSWFRKTSE